MTVRAARESTVTPEAPSAPARSPWLRRALLLGVATGGLWLAGSIGHGSTAQAAPAKPAPLAPVTSTVNKLVTGLLAPDQASQAAPAPTPKPTPRPAPKPAPKPVVPIVKTLTQQVHSAVTTLVTQTLPGTVQQLVSTVDSAVGLPVNATLPITAPKPVQPPVSLPVASPSGHQPRAATGSSDQVAKASAEIANTLFSQGLSSSSWLPAGAAQLAGPSIETPALARSASAAGDSQPAGHQPTRRPAPITPGSPSPGCPTGGVGTSSNGGQLTLSPLLPDPAATSGKLQLLATPALHTLAPRERASSPAVSPD